jgi:hypothetical protein
MLGDLSVLDAVGIHAPLLLAGFAGGLCYIATSPTPPSLWNACSGLAIGMLTANYLSELGSRVLGLGSGALAGAFGIGVCGTFVCKWIVLRAKSLNNREGGQ